MTSSYSSQPLVSIILAGGKGERFWPLSRLDRPKQFLSLDGSGLSLLQTTADRLLIPAQGWENLWVITSAQLAAGAVSRPSGSIKRLASGNWGNCSQIGRAHV